MALVDEWAAARHLIYCHAFDQAALQLLVLRSIRRFLLDEDRTSNARPSGELTTTPHVPPSGLGTEDEPLGFTCRQPRCSQNVTKGPHWSCNPLFDHTLNASGFGLLLRYVQPLEQEDWIGWEPCR